MKLDDRRPSTDDQQVGTRDPQPVAGSSLGTPNSELGTNRAGAGRSTAVGEVASAVDAMVAEGGRGQDAVIPLLQRIQDRFGYLRPDALEYVCHVTEITPAAITGVSTFYSRFRHTPVGKHIIRVCHGTACHVKGAPIIEDALRRHLNLGDGEDTDAERLFTVQEVACLGCCTMAPVIQIGDVTYGHLTSATVPDALNDYLALAKRAAKSAAAARNPSSLQLPELRISIDSCCAVAGSDRVQQALEQAVSQTGVDAVVKLVGCNGMCHQVPMVEVVGCEGKSCTYAHVGPSDAEEIVRRHFRPKSFLAQLRSIWEGALGRTVEGDARPSIARYAVDARDPAICAFAGPQKRIATEYSGQLDPLALDEYIAHDGFTAMRRALAMAPDAVVEEITRSGLRGRGGAGFPTGRKWERVRSAPGETKYVICNGDEGDPGAFMDRMLLEAFPYRVLEGMAIAAHAVGAREGIFYIRAEYPHALKRIRAAIRQCEERGILAEADLSLRVVEGAGAFVCGEETALIASVEGKRGEPRLRPPYPAESGLWGKPTNINNVETYALVPWILRHGADAFAGIGTDRSKGTKVFSLAGMVQRGGLIEVPMGATIREIVEEVGGGPPEGRTFKAVQIGGPSGGCVSAELADTPVDYESLASVGSIMGSGGIVVLDDRTCMVDLARYFLEFTQRESCGKCTMCRIGTTRLLEMLERLCRGEGRKGDLEKMEQLAGGVKQGSLCGLGQTAPNPVLSTLRAFRSEYEAHIEGRCPAGRCKPLIHYRVEENCIGCTLCAQECPVAAIGMRPFERHEIDDGLCTRCDACRTVCPEKAITVQ